MIPEQLEQNFQLLCAQSPLDGRFIPTRDNWSPRLDEDTETLNFDKHYVYNVGWAARILSETRPMKHVDISSLDYFVSVASAFVPIDFYEFRNTSIKGLAGLVCGTADLVALPFADNSIGSLSCLHVIEHIGLGRYGDIVDAGGDRKAAQELSRVLAPGGQLLMAAPCGKPQLIYNGQRIYSYQMMMDLFSGLKLREFSLLSCLTYDFIRNADPKLVEQEIGGCGLWWFTK